MWRSPASQALAAASIALFIPSTTAFFMRMYVKWTRRSWALDDYLLIASFPCAIVLLVVSILAAIDGLGTPTAELAPDVVVHIRLLLYVMNVVACPGMWLIKTSICVTILRISAHRRLFRYVIFANICVNTIVIGGAWLFILFECKPIPEWWQRTGNGSCPSYIADAIIDFHYTCFNVVTDWCIAILPIFLLRKIQMNRKTKIASVLLLGLGAVASVGGTIRLRYLTYLLHPKDFSVEMQPYLLWVTAEAELGILAVSSSALKPLYMRLFGKGDYKTTGSGQKPSHWPSGIRHTDRTAFYELGSRKGVGTIVTTQVGDQGKQADSSADDLSTDSRSQKELLEAQIRVTTDVMVYREEESTTKNQT